MSTCEFCGKEMLTAIGCSIRTLYFTNRRQRVFKRIKYGEETESWFCGFEPTPRCSDCGCKLGRYHHIGCDNEQCPRCHLQLLSCDCTDEKHDVIIRKVIR